MLTNYGLVSGMANGINQGINSFMALKNMQHTQNMEELMTGVTHDENGNLTFTPQKQQQMALQQQTMQRQQDELDPTSSVSNNYRNLARGFLESGQKGSGKNITDDMSAADIKETMPLFKSEVSGQLGMIKQMMNPMVQVKQGQLAESQNVHAGDVGKAYESNQILSSAKQKLNAMNQSSAILSNPNKPVTTKDFNAAYQDYLAGTAPGGNPTEGKAHREIPETFETQWNNLKQKFGENDDLRADDNGKALIGLLNENIRTSKNELGGQIRDQATRIHSDYLDSTNQKALQTNDRKYHEYIDEFKDKSQDQSPGLINQGNANDRINVVSPNGKHGHIPRSQLKDALAQGYKQE